MVAPFVSNTPQTKEHAGYSLLELCITLSLSTSVLYFSYCLYYPSYYKLQAKQLRTQLYNDLIYARNLAIKTQNKVCLCPSLNHIDCSNTWQHSYIIKLRTAHATNQIIKVNSLHPYPKQYINSKLFHGNKVIFYPNGQCLTNGSISIQPSYQSKHETNSEINYSIYINRAGMLQVT